MKNKNFTRFLCFFMCFCLCFAWFGPPIEAKAAGGIIGFLGLLATFMAAHGAGLAASGVADSLRNGLEGWAEEYVAYANESGVWEWTFSEWVQQIMDDVVINNAGYFALGAVAVKYLNDFMEWLQGDLGTGIQYNTDSISIRTLPVVTNSGVPITQSNYSSSGGYVPTFLGSTLSFSDLPLVVSSGTYEGYELRVEVGDDGYLDFVGYSPAGVKVGSYGSPSITADEVEFFTLQFNSYWTTYQHFELLTYCHLLDGTVNRVFWFDGDSSLSGSSVTSSGSLTLSSFDPVDTESSDFGSMVLNTGTLVADDPTNKDDYSSSIFGAIVSGEFSSTREVVSSEVTEDPTVTVPPIESDGTIEGTVSGIFSGVQTLIDLIKSIPSLILDGIKSIFIPDPDDMNNLYVGLLDEVNEKYGFDFDMGSLFGSEKQPDDITGYYSAGPLSWNLTFVSWGFLIDAVAALRPYIRGWLILMLVFYNMKQFGMLFNINGLIGGMSPSEWNSAMTPKVDGDFSLNGAYKGGKK